MTARIEERPPPLRPSPPRHGRSRPVRWLLGALAAAVVVAVVAVLRPDIVRDSAKSPRAWILVGILVVITFGLRLLVRSAGIRWVLLLVVYGVLVWLLVMPYLVDKRVDEVLPGVSAPSSAPGAAPSTAPAPSGAAPVAPPGAAASGPVKIASGPIAGIGHSAKGTASLYRLPSGEVMLRLEDIDIQRGPDYRVFLVPRPGQENTDGGLELGALKGNQGSQNYVLPAGADPSRYGSFLIWCRAFSVPIANATLTKA